jgi:hypothetical protein
VCVCSGVSSSICHQSGFSLCKRDFVRAHAYAYMCVCMRV